jgi:hypothetical protein
LKYVWLALFALFVGIASYLAEEIFFPIRPPFAQNSPEMAIYLDIKDLQSKKSLPSEIQNLNEVFISDHRLKKTDLNWVDIAKQFFHRKPKGAYDLQIEVFDAPDGEKKENASIFILQLSLFDKTSKNKIWELSRTYNTSEPAAPKK